MGVQLALTADFQATKGRSQTVDAGVSLGTPVGLRFLFPNYARRATISSVSGNARWGEMAWSNTDDGSPRPRWPFVHTSL